MHRQNYEYPKFSLGEPCRFHIE
eukprot:SAG31_NODE_10678_length_1111_cov_1.015810_1_plen_22_part_01